MKTIKISPYVPTNVDVQDLGNNRVKISAYPFESGYSITLAHPLRRLLLSSSVGFAPIGLKIDGVAHEFDSVRGIVEDVSQFIVNLKNIRFHSDITNDEEIIAEYVFKGPQILKAAHLCNDQITAINKNEPLATINEDLELKFSIIIQKGMGYVPSESIRGQIPQDFIPLDAYFTPVKNVVYDIQNIFVDDNPTYEKVTFDIETDGQINPYEAFKQAIFVMNSQMSVFETKLKMPVQKDIADPETNLMASIETLGLSQRAFNCLDKLGIKYVGELVLMDEAQIKDIKNLGTKSRDELAQKLEEIGHPIGSALDPKIEENLRKKIQKGQK